MTPEEARDKLEEFRVLIDDVDRRIVALLNERTRVVEDIGRVKRESATAHLRAQTRRPGIRQRQRDAIAGRMTEEAVRRIFERIIDEMRTIQRVRMEADGEK